MSPTILDFSAYIADCTRDFVGREWVFAEIDQWLADLDAPHYFIITGEPGIGKAAVLASRSGGAKPRALCAFMPH